MGDAVSVSSMGNVAVGKAFNAIAKGLDRDDVGEILFNWNESQLNEDDDKIINYPRRDGHTHAAKRAEKS